MLRRLTIADIPELERVQNQALPGSLPTIFGARFFRLYYASLMADSRFHSCGFFHDGRMAGFLTYTTDSGAMLRAAFGSHLAGYLWAVGTSLARQPAVIWTTLKLLPGLFAPGTQPGADVRAELLSYGVLPEFRRGSRYYAQRGVHVALELLHRAFADLREQGADRVKIFIQTEDVNAFINAFYAREGFRFVSRARRLGINCNYYIRKL